MGDGVLMYTTGIRVIVSLFGTKEVEKNIVNQIYFSKSLQTINAGKGAEKNGKLLHCWWAGKQVQPLWKTVWNFRKN